MRHRLAILIVVISVCFLGHVVSIDEIATTQKAIPLADDSKNNVTTIAPVTEPPKVDILKSDLCKKCICVADTKLLNCSYQQMTNWFNDDEWKILQNGDLIFDTINLINNNLTKIPILPKYDVKNLYLAFNEITEIEIGAFGNMTNLTRLDLSHNQLVSKVLIPDVFRGPYSPTAYLPLENLIELNLAYNNLHNFDADLFEHLPKLETLILCKNTFHVIDHLTEIAISGLTSLKTLDLSYAGLDDLPDTMFHGLRDLETLILSGNLFDEIPENLHLAINLKKLVLDENPIANLTGENIFPEFKNLEYLSLSYMPDIERIDDGALNSLLNLKTLLLSDNPKLSYIHPSAFKRNTSNPIIFDYPKLEELHLHHNNLTYLDRNLFERWDQIKVIDIRFNPWACDCTNDWLINILMTQINTDSPILTQSVQCAWPKTLNQISLISINKEQNLVCENGKNRGNDGFILLSLIAGLTTGIILTTLGIMIYKRYLNQRQGGDNRALYQRSSFNDEFHI